MNCVNSQWMNEQLSSRLCFLVHICPSSALRPALLQFSLLSVQNQAPCWFCSCFADCDGGCCCSSSHVQISNKCFALALCCVLSRLVSAPSDLSVLPPHQWLCCRHWLAFALTNHAPPKHSPSNPPPLPPHFPLLKIMTGCCDDDFLLCCAALPLPACSAPGTLPCPCPVPIGDCPPSHAPSVTDCASGNGVVHQNLGLLLTGTTSARNVSTRSRGRRFPWATTPPSRKRKCWSCLVRVCRVLLCRRPSRASRQRAAGLCAFLFVPVVAVLHVFFLYVVQVVDWVFPDVHFRSINKEQFEKKKNDTLDPEL